MSREVRDGFEAVVFYVLFHYSANLRCCHFWVNIVYSCFQGMLCRVCHAFAFLAEACREGGVGYVAINMDAYVHFDYGFFRYSSLVIRRRRVMGGYFVYGNVAGESGFSTLFSYQAFSFFAHLHYQHVFANEKFHFFARFPANLPRQSEFFKSFLIITVHQSHASLLNVASTFYVVSLTEVTSPALLSLLLFLEPRSV